MIPRSEHTDRLRAGLSRSPIVAIVGARQVGKTTLAREIARGIAGPVTLFDLENPTDLARLSDPLLALESLEGLVVIDEVQRLPELFPVLRVLVDRDRNPARFLLLGSASPDLLHQSSESLAGRIHYHNLGGLALEEVGTAEAGRLWLRGGFPRSFLAQTDRDSYLWRMDFLRTFLERDIPSLGSRVAGATLRRFWTMMAHYHGQTWNGSELARAFGVTRRVVRDYLDPLTSALVIRQLPPWHENIGKRQVRSPKVYITDSGVLHALLAVETHQALEGHPKVGASWEGFALNEVVHHLRAEPEECYFWATHNGAELDLLVVRGSRRLGFEFKRTSTPATTRSMHTIIEDLGLESLDVLYPGDRTFPLGPRIRAVGLSRLLEDVVPLG